MDRSGLFLSCVIPAYNEAENLKNLFLHYPLFYMSRILILS
jgi:hypothetical protein